MKLTLAIALCVCVKLGVYASGVEGWTSDDDESDHTKGGVSAATAMGDFSGLCDEEFPGESIEIYYETDDDGRVTSVIISTDDKKSDKTKQMGTVKLRALIGNAASASTISEIENSIKELVKTSKEYALNDDQTKNVNEAIEKLKIELLKAKNNEILTRRKSN